LRPPAASLRGYFETDSIPKVPVPFRNNYRDDFTRAAGRWLTALVLLACFIE
jgi:hypothetical protein